MHISTEIGLQHEPQGAAAVASDAGSSDLCLEDVWERALDHLRTRLDDGHFTLCFEGTQAVGISDDLATVGVRHPLARDWIHSRYLDLLLEALRLASGRSLAVDVVILSQPESRPAAPSPDPPAPARAAVSEFSDRYSFESFVIGSSNRFAHAAALAVAEGVATAYNPLFIYGGAGLGKTHLLHAIGNYVNRYHPSLVVRYVSTEQFVNEFIAALQRRTIPEFHGRYRQTDVLLIDDIQFLESKERTQEEFFHTFNALHPKSQIVITSDRSPQKLPAHEDRLRTRFLWGLVADIQPPDFETRLAILSKKAETEALHLPAEILAFIAERVQTNIRELEGALIRVAAHCSLMNSVPTLALAQNALEALISGASEERVHPDLIIAVAADYFHVDSDDICTGNRSRPLVHARQIAMYLCRELTDLSLPQIGHRFGGRDHSTVVHAINKIRTQMRENSRCYEQVQELTARIRQQAARSSAALSYPTRG